MATTFKTLTANDIVNTRTLLHEAIPLTGTIASGTYADQNVKTYSHGMFTSIFDYPYLSSSANHIFDIATGFSSNSTLSASCVSDGSVQISKKINIYNQMLKRNLIVLLLLNILVHFSLTMGLSLIALLFL